MLSTQAIEELLTLGHELREFEVKGPGMRSDASLLNPVVRAALAMGNLRDGGHVIVGIADGRLDEMEPGLTPEELASWLDYDELAKALRTYSDPPLRFDVKGRALSNGRAVAAIEIFEFADLPHLCAKAFDPPKGESAEKHRLRKGALYVRPRGMPSTTEVASSVEMREVLDLASSKRLSEFFATAARANVTLRGGPSDDELYEQERENGWE